MYFAPQKIRTYFLTTVTASRRRLFQVHENAELLIDTLQSQRSKGRIALHSFVVMPDHVHLILTPAPEVSLEKAMQYIKGSFSFRLKSKLDVWERSYDSRRISDTGGFGDRVRYIEQNPVRAHIATVAEAYPFSSAGREQLVDPIPSHFDLWQGSPSGLAKG
jgi:putative transposase